MISPSQCPQPFPQSAVDPSEDLLLAQPCFCWSSVVDTAGSAPSLFPQLCCSGIPGTESTSQLHIGSGYSHPCCSQTPTHGGVHIPSSPSSSPSMDFLAPTHEVGLISSSIHSCAQFHLSDIAERPPESFRGKQPIQCCT